MSVSHNIYKPYQHIDIKEYKKLVDKSQIFVEIKSNPVSRAASSYLLLVWGNTRERRIRPSGVEENDNSS